MRISGQRASTVAASLGEVAVGGVVVGEKDVGGRTLALERVVSKRYARSCLSHADPGARSLKLLRQQ
jgi:hypothetical protein